MSLPLCSIPSELLEEVYKKMSPRSLCRLRQTCREIDKYLEKNRLRIQSYSEPGTWVLILSIWRKAPEDKVICDFSVTPTTNHLSTNYSDGQRLTACETGITDPYIQLSAVNFSRVYVDYKVSAFEFETFEDVMLPLLISLRLKCDELYLVAEDKLLNFQPHNLIIQKNVKFSILAYIGTLSLDLYQPVMGIEAHMIGRILELPDELGPLIRHLEFADIEIGSGNGRNNVVILENFLMEVCNSKSARGNLKHFEFFAVPGDHNRLKDFDGLVDLWKRELVFKKKKQIITFQKLKIDGGIAYIRHGSPNRHEVYFYDDSHLPYFYRQELFNITAGNVLEATSEYKKLSAFETFYMKVLYRSFLNAPDDQTALAMLFRSSLVNNLCNIL